MIYTINANELPPTIRATYGSIRRRIVSCSLTIDKYSSRVAYIIGYVNEWNGNRHYNTWYYNSGWNMGVKN